MFKKSLLKQCSLRSSGMRRKQNFEIVFGFKCDKAVLTFSFRFLFLHLYSLFLSYLFYLFLAFRGKAFRIFKLDDRKGRWDRCNKDKFSAADPIMIVFCQISTVSLTKLIVLILIRFKRSLHTTTMSADKAILHHSNQSCILQLCNLALHVCLRKLVFGLGLVLDQIMQFEDS